MEKPVVTFSEIVWGEDEARNDSMLENYFVEFPGYPKILTGQKRYIIGRKGTGKSAILQKIRLDAQSDATLFCCDISLRDFPLNDFKSLGDRGLQDKSKYVCAWKFLLLTEIANLVVQDNSIPDTVELDALRDFLNKNFPDGISITDTITKLRQNENKISMVLSLLSGENTMTDGSQMTAQIHYNKAVKALEKIFSVLHSDSTFVLLVDELDEGYRARNSNLSLVLLALLRATDEIFAFFKQNSMKCVPVVALRSDIYDNLEDNDLNKLDDYVLRLNWTTDEDSQWSLKQIAEKRIEATVKSKDPHYECDDYWKLVSSNKGISKGLWQYICILTFSRPRDIIKLLKYCSESVKEDKLTIIDVQKVETDYSAWFYREFRDEVQSFLPCWKGALNCLSEVAKGKEKISILSAKLEANHEVKTWCRENNTSPLDVIKVLFNYSVIGCINDEGRWIFKYKDDYFEFMPSYPYYCVHFGFCRKLRILRSYDHSIIEAYRNYN